MEKLETKFNKNETLLREDDLIAYEKHSYGAIELHRDYVVLYSNLLHHRNATKGRITHIIYLNNISEFSYKGTGWFPGFMTFRFKNTTKALTSMISVWWIWRRIKFNNNLTPIFDYIGNYIINVGRSDQYRKIETVKEIRERGCCPNCGQPLIEGQKFCSKCGNKVGE